MEKHTKIEGFLKISESDTKIEKIDYSTGVKNSVVDIIVPLSKKIETKKIETKKIETKKIETKKIETKKIETKKIFNKVKNFFISKDRKIVLAFIDNAMFTNNTMDEKRNKMIKGIMTSRMKNLLLQVDFYYLGEILSNVKGEGFKKIMNMDVKGSYTEAIVMMLNEKNRNEAIRVLSLNYEEMKMYIFKKYYYTEALKKVGTSNIDELYKHF